MTEEELLQKFTPDRVKQMKRFCMQRGLWEFDMYEPDRVLYNVVEKQTFESSR